MDTNNLNESGTKSKWEQFREGLRLDQLNPYARNQAVNDPFAFHRIEEDKLAQDFVVDADSAMIAQDPLRATKAIRNVPWLSLPFWSGPPLPRWMR